MNKIKLVALLVAILGTLLFFKTHFDSSETWENLNKKGLSAYHESRYVEAEKHFLKAVKLAEISSKEGHRLYFSLNQLAEVYRIQSKFTEAEQVLKQLLESYKKYFGPKHINVALTLNNLAVNYRARGKFEESENLLKQALEILEESFDSNHPLVGNILEHYAHLLHEMGRHSEAERLESRFQKISSETNKFEGR
ncbi:MAG: tetratricopeptide repeat protein [Nitrospinae bacterium]|nr:tetratricopeptide repeat protein [Nitrospinota bacterium]